MEDSAVRVSLFFLSVSFSSFDKINRQLEMEGHLGPVSTDHNDRCPGALVGYPSVFYKVLCSVDQVESRSRCGG